ncbi:MAG: hypothetical protein B7Z37_24585 [Verrucomicrobia bacterium 12-59-8]|nr:MAG: hypothetical protein B7Z37_24585 [Verrucomicrobia bacterium 12-59-8]
MVNEALDLHARWPEMSLEEKRRVAELMVRTIVVGDGEIEFNLVQLPPIKKSQIGKIRITLFCHFAFLRSR